MLANITHWATRATHSTHMAEVDTSSCSSVAKAEIFKVVLVGESGEIIIDKYFFAVTYLERGGL